jgi:short-subunit dehydrogenase
MRASFEDLELDVIKRVMDINFYGAVNATKACLSEIIKNKGSIVGISSIAGYRGLPGRTGYSASKFALQGFLEVLRAELMHRGVHVLIASPGFTASNIRKTALSAEGTAQAESPRKEEKMMTAEEVARKVYLATLKRRRVLIFTLQGKLVRWISYLMPGLADKLVYNAMANEPDSPFPKV